MRLLRWLGKLFGYDAPTPDAERPEGEYLAMEVETALASVPRPAVYPPTVPPSSPPSDPPETDREWAWHRASISYPPVSLPLTPQPLPSRAPRPLYRASSGPPPPMSPPPVLPIPPLPPPPRLPVVPRPPRRRP